MLGDTIFAVASPPGAAARGLIRISGPDAWACAGGAVVAGDSLPRERAAVPCGVTVLGHTVEALAITMPAPRSFTGEDVVELHVVGSPLLLAKICDLVRAAGGRDATPGEFTRRAFENGRVTLAEAEAVRDLIHASSVEEAGFAADVIEGALAEVVGRTRARIQDGLAMIEAGLDFDDGETGSVAVEEWLPHLEVARRELVAFAAEVPRAQAVGDIVLGGAANAGKSSLCNALAGEEVVLVADRAGTTRDVIVVELESGVRLLDVPGDLADAHGVDRSALALRERLAGRAGAALLVLDPASAGVGVGLGALPEGVPVLAVVYTKADLVPGGGVPWERPAGVGADVPVFGVSNLSGDGIEELREFLARRARGGPCGGAGRVVASLESATVALDEAIAGARDGHPDEVVACAVGAALEELDRVHGRSSPEDLLDRVFGTFCLGK